MNEFEKDFNEIEELEIEKDEPIECNESTPAEDIIIETVHHVDDMLRSEPPMIKAEAPTKKHKKMSGFRKKVIAAGLVAAIGGVSLGLGAGIGISGVLLASEGRTALASGAAQDEATGLETQETFTFSDNNEVKYMSLASKNGGVASIVKAVSDAVVSINVTAPMQTYFNRTIETNGSGSGIIFAETQDKVFIVTNNHVISDANNVTISIDDTTEVPAHYVGSDSQSDLAVIYVSKDELTKAGIKYKVATLGDSDVLEVGELVVAIGNALGEGKSATLGIISANNKSVTIDGKKLTVIQTDAAINPGNSGGALVDENGEVIGVNTAKLSSSSVEGTGYSIPSNTVKKVIEDLMQNGSVQKPYLGIQGQTITEELKSAYSMPSTGVYVVSTVTDSSASEAGLVASDIIVGYGDKKITTMEELSEAISQSKVGDKVKLTIYRNGKTQMEITATIKNMNTEPSF